MNEIIKSLEKERRHALIPFWILLAMLVVSLFLISQNPPVGIVGAVASGVVYGVLYSRFRKSYIKKYKDIAVRATLENEYENLRYDPKAGISSELISALGCMKMGTDFVSEDYFSGSLDGVSFQASDVRIDEQTTDSRSQTCTETLFEGRWLVFDFGKSFKSTLMVRQKGFSNAKTDGNLLATDIPSKKLRTENELFNYSFVVYGGEERDAACVLTPPVMDSLLKLKERVGGKLLLCFSGSKLHVALCDNNDACEPPMFKRITVESLTKDVIGQIRDITTFARELSLEKKIWSAGGNDFAST